MEIPYSSPSGEDGGGQPALHGNHYLALESDVHYRAGMVCQDCHSSFDLHGDGFLHGTSLPRGRLFFESRAGSRMKGRGTHVTACL